MDETHTTSISEIMARLIAVREFFPLTVTITDPRPAVRDFLSHAPHDVIGLVGLIDSMSKGHAAQLAEIGKLRAALQIARAHIAGVEVSKESIYGWEVGNVTSMIDAALSDEVKVGMQ